MRLLTTVRHLLLIAVPLAVGHGQSAFDAASIKPAAPPGAESNNQTHIEYTPVSLTMRNVGLNECVQWAYDVEFFQVTGIDLRSSYDIFAKTANPVQVSQLRLMLQELLARRFQLAVHRETRMQPVYQLTVAKGGARLSEPKAGGDVHAAESLPRIENGAFVFHDVTLAKFAAMLHQLNGVDLPVVDRTGIAGTYDLVLKGAPGAARQGDSMALFASVEDELGLHLSPAKAPMEMLVIDRAVKPEPNEP